MLIIVKILKEHIAHKRRVEIDTCWQAFACECSILSR